MCMVRRNVTDSVVGNKKWINTMRILSFSWAAVLLGWVMCGGVAAQEKISIEGLLKDGWEIAGYTAPGDNRSSFVLFRHPKKFHLVNCRIGYDVTRAPRSYVNCYILR